MDLYNLPLSHDFHKTEIHKCLKEKHQAVNYKTQGFKSTKELRQINVSEQ